MKSKMTLLLAVPLIALSCARDEPANDGSDPAASGQEWLAEVMIDPEYQRACAEIEGCVEAEQPWTGRTETIWRIQVIRETSGAIRIGRVDTVTVPEGDGVPVGPLTGDYLLVGTDSAGASLDGQLIQFPRTLRLEFRDRSVRPEETDLAAKRVDTTGYVRALPTIETLAVKDESGATLASVPVPPTTVAHGPPDTPGFVGLASPAWALAGLGSGLPPYCSHVRILEGEADREVAGTLAFEGLVTLERPGPYQLATVKETLNRMTPLLCHSVGRIAFASFPAMESYAAGAVLQAGEGHLIMINTASGFDEASLSTKRTSQLYLNGTLLHESGHAAEALLNAAGNSPGLYGGDWPATSRTLAARTIDHVRLRKGFGEEWRRVHDSFIALDWASSYSETGLVTGSSAELTERQVTDGGFMTPYGSNIWWDDIAEFISVTYMSRPLINAGFPEEYREDHGCKEMRAFAEKGVPSRLAAVYTKLLFIRDLGLVHDVDVDDCIGNNLGLPPMSEGFDFWQGTMKLTSFQNDVSAGIGTETLGNRVFEMRAAGETEFMQKKYPTTLRLRLDLGGTIDSLDEVSWPRGVYELGLMGDNNLELRLDGAKAGNFDAMDGFVMVAESSNDRIAGSVVVQRVMRLHAPLPVPEVYDPPLVIRFLIDN